MHDLRPMLMIEWLFSRPSRRIHPLTQAVPPLPWSVPLIVAEGSFHNVLQIFEGFRQDRARSRAAVHIADVAFMNHCVENSGGASVADSKMSLQKRSRCAF